MYFALKRNEPLPYRVVKIAILLLAALWVGLLIYAVFPNDTPALNALAEGKRVVIDAKTGEIGGFMVDATLIEAHQKDNETATDEPAIGETEADESANSAAQASAETEITDGADANSIDPTIATPAASREENTISHTLDTIPQFNRDANSIPLVSKGLIEETDAGRLPKISAAGIKPANYYALPYSPSGEPEIAIILYNAGINQALTTQAYSLPKAIGFAFSPYQNRLSRWMDATRNNGRESWLELPLQSVDYPANDPGPMGLLADSDKKSVAEISDKIMASAEGYVGLVSTQPETFSANVANFGTLISHTNKRGIPLLFGGASQDTIERLRGYKAVTLAHATFDRSIFATDEVARSLAQVESAALKSGRIVVLVEASPVWVESLKIWLPTLAHKGLRLVPASALTNS